MKTIRYQVNEEAVSERDFGDSLMLVTGGEGTDPVDRFFRLNEAASLIWKTIRDGGGVDEAVQALTSTYEVDTDTALQDTEAIIAQLIDFGAISPAKS